MSESWPRQSVQLLLTPSPPPCWGGWRTSLYPKGMAEPQEGGDSLLGDWSRVLGSSGLPPWTLDRAMNISPSPKPPPDSSGSFLPPLWAPTAHAPLQLLPGVPTAHTPPGSHCFGIPASPAPPTPIPTHQGTGPCWGNQSPLLSTSYRPGMVMSSLTPITLSTTPRNCTDEQNEAQ